FAQRVSPLAQPEIEAVAALMQEEYERSDPELLEEGEWHMPYLRDEDWDDAVSYGDLISISVARCARVSYLTQDGVRDQQKDLDLYKRLVEANPMHASPLEHVATPDSWNIRKERIGAEYGIRRLMVDGEIVARRELTLPRVGNFIGWRQHRFDVEMSKGIHSYA
ncbi:MAG: hypothetical protein R3330_07010, partial [Saprospiraceae bacterium]|nr:hypothetical protein [Saprospiraceae bacterium]